MILMAVVMMLGMSFASVADEVKCYEGNGVFRFDMRNIENNRDDTFIADYVRLEAGTQYKRLIFSNGIEEHNLYFEIIDGVEYLTNYNGTDYTYLGEAWHNFGTLVPDSQGNLKLGSKISFGEGNVGWFYIDYNMSLTLIDDITEHQVSTGFTGTAVSDRGDYNLYIAGYFRKDLTNGTHTLALSDITSQTIAVIAHNNANGVNRNMNQSTIEEMTVTVSGGEVIEMIIRGRVQTDGGTLDRYTATINP